MPGCVGASSFQPYLDARIDMKMMLLCAVVLGIGLAAWAQTTQPARTPAPSAGEMLNELFSPAPRQAPPLLPVPPIGQLDATSLSSVAPGAEPARLLPEGARVFNRRVLLRQTPDGQPEIV
jgi:hypothetical protein